MLSLFWMGSKEPESPQLDLEGSDDEIDVTQPPSYAHVVREGSGPVVPSGSSRLTDIYAWGSRDLGRLGLSTQIVDPDSSSSRSSFSASQPSFSTKATQSSIDACNNTPQLIHSLIGKKFRSVSCGSAFTAAVTTVGQVYVWGNLGDSKHWATHLSPRLLIALQGKDVRQISCGDRHLALLTQSGEVLTAGVSAGGRLGHPPSLSSSSSSTSSSLSSASSQARPHASSSSGKINDGYDLPRRIGSSRPGYVAGMSNINNASNNNNNNNNSINANASKGKRHGLEPDDLRHPKRVDSLQGKGVRQVACGEEFTMALTDNDDVYTWGSGESGALGHGIWTSESVPRIVQSLKGKAIIEVAAGARHAACVTTSGEVITWGCGMNGRLGHGGCTDIAVGMVVKALLDERVAQVSLGMGHSLALTETGKVFAWGANHFGQLGLGHTDEIEKPRQIREISTESRVVAVRCGSFHSACLTSTGEVFTWGCGNQGALGHGDGQRKLVPTPVAGLRGKGATDIACGPRHSVAITHHVWIEDEEVNECLLCQVEFSFFTRRSHCRHCGRIFCRSCASNYLAIPRFGFHKPVRVCDVCHEMLSGN